MATRDKPRGPGLNSMGNRILLAVAIGWLAWFLTGGLPSGSRLIVLVVVAAISYAIVTAVRR